MIENKTIGIIGDYPPTSGGIATGVKEVVNVLSKKNRVILITPSQRSSFEFFDGVEIHRVKKIQRKHLTMLTTILSLMKKAFSLRNKVDLFHCHGFTDAGIGLIDKGVPLILTVHGYPALESVTTGRIKDNSIELKLLRRIEKEIAKRANAIIAVDSTIQNWLREDLKVNEQKLFCIPNGVNTRFFSPFVNGEEIRKKYGIKENEKLIVVIRRFTPKNGVEIALNAFDLLVKKYGFRNVRLLLAGGGELKERFARIIAENKLGNIVILEDLIFHDEIPKYFSSADIIVNTFTHIHSVKEFEVSSLFEAFEKVRPIATSNTTLEALSSGKATVVSTVGGKFKDISSDDIGVLTPDNDPEILAGALSKLLSSERLAKSIGKNGREYVEKERTWNMIAEKISEVYNFAISRN